MNKTYDNELLILSQIDANPDTTQRDLSRHTGLSLGSVNLLLKKMAKEGLIKIESIPAHRVAYMLTPRGMVEKANKTVNYIKRHYNAINQTKENIKTVMTTLLAEHPTLYILRTQDEVGNLVVTAVEEMPPAQAATINFIHTMEEAKGSHIPVVHCVPDESLEHMGYANPTINLLEKL
ncbi:winged helix-turn-helix transcriptional regulator [Anaerotalea alkaliphila]|uniref:Winged helix-turn-helix transcriptional regulator n=1 Tax=Anaerotalea alkaliphila TaxID=2662126 RepID=A0A7X5HXZ2_9FIRM|nr:winged helix-turn-helix transcriptional regulator [Anaerotalea alkaliphila]NDL68720.1 winged helix-turn-helix transcriptional regulator [Anaerotalea alkaliphila]